MPNSNPQFDPDDFFDNWNDDEFIPSGKNGVTFRECMIRAFDLPDNDDYVYRAHGATTLDLTQRAINGKRANGLHAWYHDEEGKPLNPPHPTTLEITAYNSLFLPTPNPLKALTSFASSSSPHTLRHLISTHLLSQVHYPYPSLSILPPHSPTRTHPNPSLSLLHDTNHELEWAGPTPYTAHTKASHHILPVLYHHFGCVPPTYASLYAIGKLAQPRKGKDPVRRILDMGSGNGYWTYMLRRFPLPERQNWKPLTVHAIDNGHSDYRTMWINDTIRSDAVTFLNSGHVADWNAEGGKDCILLLVYPQTTGGFTESVLRTFKGDVIVYVGTQCGNGFTGFREEVVDVWIGREMPEFECVLKMPMPSFAGKDEGFFVFKRKET